MHIAPTPLAYATSPERGLRTAGDCSRLTHGAPEAIDACRYLSALIIGAVDGYAKEDLLTPSFDIIASGVWRREPLAPRIVQIADGAFRQGPPIFTTKDYGDAATALHAALWGFSSTDTFEEGLLKIVNLGWDADTMGAVYGQLAGAYYGQKAIPAKWRAMILKRRLILSLADELLALSLDP